MEKLLTFLNQIPEYRLLLDSVAKKQPAAVTGIGQINRSHFIAALRRQTPRPLVVVCQDDMAAKRLQEELKAFASSILERFYNPYIRHMLKTISLNSLSKWETRNFPTVLDNWNKAGKVAEKELVKADITVNKNMVPFDSRSPFQTSGIRVGTPAITSRGFVEKDMEFIVNLIDQVLTNAAANLDLIAGKTEEGREAYEEVLASVRKQVRMKTNGMPLNRY